MKYFQLEFEMSSAFAALQNACSAKTFESISKLKPGKYRVASFKLLNTRYGLRVAVLIERVYYYLPNYVAEHVNTQKHIMELNSVTYEMNYLGKDASQKNRIILRFEPFHEDLLNMELEDGGIDVVG